MSNPEEMLEKLGQMLADQLSRSDAERKEAVKREERMNSLLQEALLKIPTEQQQPHQGQQPQHEGRESKIPNSATPAPILSQNASLREFMTWKQKFTDFTLLTGVDKDTNDRQKAVLRSLLDDEWYRIVKFALNIDMKNPTVTVKTIIDKMQTHLRSQRNIVLDRKEFYARNQQPSELFDDYYIALQEIAAFCDFCPQCTDQQFRDRIVTGIRDEETLKELLAEKDLTLEKTINICRANENATKDTENLHATPADVNKVTNYRKSYQPNKVEKRNSSRPWRDKDKYYQESKNRFSKDRPQQDRTAKCKFCGRNWHEQLSQCTARNQNCAKCGIRGHFATVCMRSITAESDDSSSDNAWRVTLAGVNERHCSKKTPKVIITVIHDNKEVQMVTTPDTGAEMSVIGVKEARQAGIIIENLRPTTKKLYAADRKRLSCLGTVEVQLKLGNKSSHIKLMVITEVEGFLLSWYHAIDLGILHENFPQQIRNIEADIIPENPPTFHKGHPSSDVRKEHAKLIMETFKPVFDTKKELKPMIGKPMKIILTDDAVPYALTAPRNIPFAWREKIKSQLDEMVAKNIIEVVTEPTSWCHPMVPVPKRNSSEVRVCVDLTRLNKYVKRGPHPVITALDAVSRVQKGSRYFSKLDAKAGYWQVPISKEDQVLTTFITPWGRYKFLRAPMGLSVSGDEYNRRGDDALQGCNNTVKVVDDVLVYDREYQQHLNHIWDVLKQCLKYGVTLNPDKFFFAEQSIEYCGYQLSEEGFLPDKGKLSAIKNFKIPGNITELRSFMGVVNQLGQFSPTISTLAEPLRQLLKKNNEFKWVEYHTQAFEQIKNELIKPPTLAYYDPNLPITLQTDAARLKGLGFVCLQKHEQGWKLVDCGSRFLTDAETRYATIELEMLAIVFAVKKCRKFLLGRQEFDVITDHKPLISIVNNKGLNEIENPRLQRLKESISQYNLILKWRKGTEHEVPDAFSRNPTERVSEEDKMVESDIEEQIHSVVLSNIYEIQEEHEDSLLDDVRKASKIDPEYQLLYETITKGFPNDNNIPTSLRQYLNKKDMLCIDQGLVVCGQRLLIPKSMRKEILKRLHSSHQGIEKTRRRARQCVYWPGINNDVENVVKSCKQCQILLPSQQKETMIQDPLPKRPFQIVSADYFQFAGREYLIYTDRLTGWPMVKAFNKEATASNLISTLRKFFEATGVPEMLKTDNGSQFTANNVKKFLSHWAVKHITSSPHYPQSNGHAEVSVKIIKHLIMKSTKNGNLDTDEFTAALIEMRNTPRNNGLSPSQMLFGYPLRSIIPIHPRSYMKKWQRNVDEADVVRKRQETYAEQKYNTHAKDLPELSPGTLVNLQDHRTGRWSIEGKIVDVAKNRKYLVKKKDGGELWRNRKFIRKRYQKITCLPHEKPDVSADSPLQPQNPYAIPQQPDRYPRYTQHPYAEPQQPHSSYPKPSQRPYALSQQPNTIPPNIAPNREKGVGRPSRKRGPPDRLIVNPGSKTYSC